MKRQNYFFLIVWIVSLVAIGFAIGYYNKPELSVWYESLHRSPLTPPNYVFSVVWTILYGLIGFCGWLIWSAPNFLLLRTIKSLYGAQLMLNWLWTPLFFYYQLIGLALLVLLGMIIVVMGLIFLAYKTVRAVSFFMMPYLVWLLFAGYLNFYIWFYN